MGTNQLNLSAFLLPLVQKILFNRLLLNLTPRVLSLDLYNEVKDNRENLEHGDVQNGIESSSSHPQFDKPD